MKYLYIKKYSSEHSVMKMCQIFEISRSGYYDWFNKPKSERQLEDEKILEEIMKIREYEKKKVYGYPRIHAELKSKGFGCSKNRVAKIMKNADIKAKTIKRYKKTTISNHDKTVADNLLQQKFEASKINEIWTSDITYIWTQEGWLYLAVILDVFSRQIVGWSMSNRIDKRLVLNALNNALIRQGTDNEIIFHSDKGVQYASNEVRYLLKNVGFKQSMSGTGNCYDNAITESFFHSLKMEHVCFKYYRTRQEAKNSIFDYIEIFYNRERRHSSLGYLSPLDYADEFSKAA